METRLRQNRLDRWPVATISVLAITGIVTALQFVYLPLLPALQRTPSALAFHQWWRLFTPLLVHSDGPRQIAFNFSAILIVGTLAERIFGHWRWLVIYFACGLVGEIFGYLWQPSGAGNSIAGAGLLGALALWLLRERKAVQAKIGGAIILLGALILIYYHDIHGPPILAGALIAFTILHTSKKSQRPVAQ